MTGLGLRRRSALLLRTVYLLIGVAVLAYVLAAVDLRQVGDLVARVGWGFLPVLGIHLLGFSADALSWLVALLELPLDWRRFRGLLLVRLAGEALSSLTVSGIAGEPMKVVLVHRLYGTDPRAIAASQIIATTLLLLAYLVFAAVGFAALASMGWLPDASVAAIGVGLAGFALAVLSFFGVQRLRVASLVGSRLTGIRWLRGLNGALRHIREVDDRLLRFYSARPGRMFCGTALAFAGWLLGALEIWVITRLLGQPCGAMQAWAIETIVQLSRHATFFVPVSLGAQEATLLFLYGAMFGDPSLGVAVSLVRRLREALWIGCGLLAGWRFIPRTSR